MQSMSIIVGHLDSDPILGFTKKKTPVTTLILKEPRNWQKERIDHGSEFVSESNSDNRPESESEQHHEPKSESQNYTWTQRYTWHRIVAWGNIAERSSHFLQKDSLVLCHIRIDYKKLKIIKDDGSMGSASIPVLTLISFEKLSIIDETSLRSERVG